MSPHTPGPWMVDCIADDFDGAIDIVSEFTVDADGRKTANWIASCDLQDDRIEENHANARLIAAAPELLAALRVVVETFGPWHDGDCPSDDTCDCSAKPIHDAVNAAIVKAEG